MCQSVREQKYPLSRKKIQRVAIRLHNENAKLSESLLADQGSALCIRVSTIAVQMRQISAQQELRSRAHPTSRVRKICGLSENVSPQ
jgi:hypothetical protein